MGRILSVNISNHKGEKKHPVASCPALINTGLENDAHAGRELRQISLLADESIGKMRRQGLCVSFGDFAENLTTAEIDLISLPLGTKLKVGNDVLLEVTQIGKVCPKPCAIFYTVGECVMPKEGIFTRVLTAGVIHVGDEITVLDNNYYSGN
ncbi:MAG TPA: MOSC domain-containing protein [Smithellaceae bacterium]|nr:MOSC domain-containing protein [Smithellaceae bacterium]